MVILPAMMRTAIAALLLLPLAACSSAKPSAPTTTAAPTISASGALDEAYLKVMREYLPKSTDAQLVAVGHGVCREFNDGLSWTSILTGFLNGGTPARTSGAVIAVSVVTFCPEHQSDLP